MLSPKENSGRRIRWTKRVAGMALVGLTGLSGNAQAGEFEFLGIDGSWSLQAAYPLAVRTEKPDDGIINTFWSKIGAFRRARRWSGFGQGWIHEILATVGATIPRLSSGKKDRSNGGG